MLPQKLWMNSAAWEHLMHPIQVKGAAAVGFFELALCFSLLFLSFAWTRQCLMFFKVLLLRSQLIFVVHFEDVKLFAGWGQHGHKVEQ